MATAWMSTWPSPWTNDYGCHETVLIQPENRSRKKTDRRDASVLSQLLWVNRQRVLGGKRVQCLKRIILPSQEEKENRQLTALRQRTAALRTRTINKVQHILLKHNLQQECPTKGMKTKKARLWLTELLLGAVGQFRIGTGSPQFIAGQPQVPLGTSQPQVAQMNARGDEAPEVLWTPPRQRGAATCGSARHR